MRLPLIFFKGSPEKPAVVFIHGLGMNALQWVSPSETRIFGGALPFSTITRVPPETLTLKEKPNLLPEIFTIGNPIPLETSFTDLHKRGHTVITWNQTKPLSSIKYALEELKRVVQFAETMTKKGIILIGNSRGGLIGRLFLESNPEKVKALITIATPHRGSNLANWIDYLSGSANLIEKIAKIFPYGTKKIIERLSDFISSEGVRELLPESSLIKSLKRDLKLNNVFYLAGSNPNLFNLYRWKSMKREDNYILYPEKIFTFPESLFSIIPERLIPKEWTDGDGLVSLESAIIDKIPGRVFKLNHGEILVNRESKEFVLKIVEEILS